ncbi:competence protein CoiA family protein [Alistipes onderdonkii]|uniref:competence protein CoiA family protein n=1 Tax=Alistipes onderdonkii TaxID=328813 RepID=UPI0013969A4D|nr:competence protein CoiA family protein [Alistipes onderdonkii]
MKHIANTDQHYALNPEGELVWIKDARRNDKFTCVSCGGEMIVKQGKVREWHFAHKTLSENCSHESYLHSLAKIKIHDWFYRADQFMLGLNTEFKCSHIDSCIWFDIGNPSYCIQEKLHIIDLKKYYNSCDIERTYNSFRADLFVYNNQFSKSPIFIEICVNHPCSEEKINSGIRIIEIVIKSEEEIESIISSTISERDDCIRLYNFNPKSQVIDSCYKELTKFVLLKDNRGFFIPVGDVNCRTYTERNTKSIFELTCDSGSLMEYSIYQIGMVSAYKYKYPVRSCFLCKFHRRNEDKYMYDDGDAALPIFCCLYKKLETNKYCKSTKAIECKAFTIDKELCNAVERKMRTCYADIWEREKELPL